MDQAQSVVDEPPSVPQPSASFSARAFERGTARYLGFLQALLDGLLEYEAGVEGRAHAAAPLPAA